MPQKSSTRYWRPRSDENDISHLLIIIGGVIAFVIIVLIIGSILHPCRRIKERIKDRTSEEKNSAAVKVFLVSTQVS